MDQQPGFNEGLRARLTAAGYTPEEMQIGALMAETQAALKMVDNPLAAFAVSNTFSKLLAHLSERDNVAPERVCAIGDIIYESAMSHAKDTLAKAKAERQGDGEQSNSWERRTVMMDSAPAVDPKDIN